MQDELRATQHVLLSVTPDHGHDEADHECQDGDAEKRNEVGNLLHSSLDAKLTPPVI